MARIGPSRRLSARGPTYVLIVGAVIGILGAGLAVPLGLGHADRAAAHRPDVTIAPFGAGPVVDHDTRPPALYDDLPLVRGTQLPTGSVRTASDVGITASSITVGVILVGLGAVSAFGIDTSALDPKVQRGYWDAAIARVNAAGGVWGRRLNAVYATGDVLSRDSMRAACRTLTEDHRVFAVANVLGVSGDPILCVTRDHATPYVGIDGADPSYYRLSMGRLVTLEPSTERTLAILFDRLRASGLLRGHRVGVVHQVGSGGVASGVLQAAVSAAGASAFVDGPLGDEDPLVVSGQVAAAQVRMQQAGVDTVLLLTNAVYGTVFGTQADQSRYTPTFLMSDLGYATAGDAFLANMPPSFFGAAFAVTTTEIGRGRANLAESRLDAGCRSDYERVAGHPVARDSGDAAAALASCALVQVMTMGLNAAGVNPTRGAFIEGLARTGPFALPGFGRGVLSPARSDAADDVAVAKGIANCQCWIAIDGYRQAPAPG